MSDKVDHAVIRRDAPLILAALAVLIILLAVLGPIVFESVIGHRESERQAARLVEALSIGDSRPQVEAMIAGAEYDRLTLVKIDNPSWLVRTPEVMGAANWVIWIDFDGEGLSRAAVRTADSATVTPAGAPPDKPQLR